MGAVCRVMKNFGMHELVVVDPQGAAAADLGGSQERSASAETARRLAVHAQDVLDGARICSTVAEAVADATLVVGTSRRQGQKRKGAVELPEEFAGRAVSAAPACVALLFGNERFGLNAGELMHASQLVAIPSDPACPSLNLSHAVAVLCYVLYQAGMEAGAVSRPNDLSVRSVIPYEQLHALVADMESSLHAMNFLTQDGPQGMSMFLTDVLGRAGLTPQEAARLRRLFSSLAGRFRST